MPPPPARPRETSSSRAVAATVRTERERPLFEPGRVIEGDLHNEQRYGERPQGNGESATASTSTVSTLTAGGRERRSKRDRSERINKRRTKTSGRRSARKDQQRRRNRRYKTLKDEISEMRSQMSEVQSRNQDRDDIRSHLQLLTSVIQKPSPIVIVVNKDAPDASKVSVVADSVKAGENRPVTSAAHAAHSQILADSIKAGENRPVTSAAVAARSQMAADSIKAGENRPVTSALLAAHSQNVADSVKAGENRPVTSALLAAHSQIAEEIDNGGELEEWVNLATTVDMTGDNFWSSVGAADSVKAGENRPVTSAVLPSGLELGTNEDADSVKAGVNRPVTSVYQTENERLDDVLADSVKAGVNRPVTSVANSTQVSNGVVVGGSKSTDSVKAGENRPVTSVTTCDMEVEETLVGLETIEKGADSVKAGENRPVTSADHRAMDIDEPSNELYSGQIDACLEESLKADASRPVTSPHANKSSRNLKADGNRPVISLLVDDGNPIETEMDMDVARRSSVPLDVDSDSSSAEEMNLDFSNSESESTGDDDRKMTTDKRPASSSKDSSTLDESLKANSNRPVTSVVDSHASSSECELEFESGPVVTVKKTGTKALEETKKSDDCQEETNRSVAGGTSANTMASEAQRPPVTSTLSRIQRNREIFRKQQEKMKKVALQKDIEWKQKEMDESPSRSYLKNKLSQSVRFRIKQKGRFTSPYSMSNFPKGTIGTAVQFFNPKLSMTDYEKLCKRAKFNEAKSYDTFVFDRQKLLATKPFLKVNNKNEEIFLSGLAYLVTFNESFHPDNKHFCPCCDSNRIWLYCFCSFQDSIPNCPDTAMSLNALERHLIDKSETCRWHQLIRDFMRKVFVPDRRLREISQQEEHETLLKTFEFSEDEATDDEDGDPKYVDRFYEIDATLDRKMYKNNTFIDTIKPYKEEVPKVLNRPYILSIFEGLSMRDCLKMQCPYLDVEWYITNYCLDSFPAYEKNYIYYVEHRRDYLSNFQDIIEINDADDKDKIFLSGLIYLTTFTNMFSHFSWCPCSPWLRNWLYHFCDFHAEIPLCKSRKSRGIMHIDELHDHASENVECRWHNLIFRFMNAVFFNTDDNFLPKDYEEVNDDSK